MSTIKHEGSDRFQQSHAINHSKTIHPNASLAPCLISKKPFSVPRPAPEAAFSGETEIAAIKALLKKNDYEAVIRLTENSPMDSERCAALLRLGALARANLGRHESARQMCMAAMKKDEFHPGPHLLLAQIAMETGDIGEAKACFKKAVYLDDTCVFAYLELAGLFEAEQNFEKALQMRKAALFAVKNRAGRDEFEHFQDLTPSELMDHIRRQIEKTPESQRS